jgi:hypothetical protein
MPYPYTDSTDPSSLPPHHPDFPHPDLGTLQPKKVVPEEAKREIEIYASDREDLKNKPNLKKFFQSSEGEDIKTGVRPSLKKSLEVGLRSQQEGSSLEIQAPNFIGSPI